MATRIIVKNVPPYVTQDAFAKHFSDYSSPTDSRLQTSKSGKSRRFGFVGFQSDAEAAQAVQYWHNTYIGSTKISAELARTVEEEASTNYKRKRVEDATATAQSAKEVKRQKPSNDLRKAEEEDPKFKEFLRLNQSRTKSKTFLNDDEEFVQQAVEEEEQADVSPANEETDYEDLPQAQEEEEVYEVIEHDMPAPPTQTEELRVAPVVPDEADDAEWLRHRTSRTLDLTDVIEPLEPLDTPVISVSVAPASDKMRSAPRITKTLKMVEPVKTEEELEVERLAVLEATKNAALAIIKETSRLFLRNLAFTVNEAALQTLFENYGTVQEVHIPQTKDGAHKGLAYIHFDRSADAVSAFEDLDGKSFHGRLLHILPGQAKVIVEKPLAPGAKTNIGEKRKEERRKEAAKSRFNWNALFLNQNAVLEQTAKKFGVSKSELLDPSESGSAVTMALAESSALSTIKKFFLSHGVNLQSFSQTKQKDDSILLFKNLPSSATEDTLRTLVEGAGGVIRRIVMPDMGGLAIIEVLDGNQGKSVFGKLAYRKLGDTLIYLEKGPIGTFTTSSPDAPTATAAGAAVKSGVEEAADQIVEEEDDEAESERATLFVKNLNFETRAADLTRVFETLQGFRQATVKTKPNPKDPSSRLSMGFGFVQFARESDARLAMSTMQKFTLDGHALDLKLSTGKSTDRSTTTTTTATATGRSGMTKVVVKNLPFETTKSDLSRLFGTYGALKSLRLPKKHNSHLRGFAFLEFLSHREAKNAIAAVEGTHLLGRRLVLEYAEQDAIGDAGIDRLVAKTRGKQTAIERSEGGKRKVGKVYLDGDEAPEGADAYD